MLPLALAAVAAAFVLLFVFRVGGARRAALASRWPGVVLAGAATLALARGLPGPALALAALASAAWMLWPAHSRGARNQAAADSGDLEASALLGVTLDASAEDIRRAYRAKMAHAHPDRGGGHAQAAQLTAARDRLLRRRR